MSSTHNCFLNPQTPVVTYHYIFICRNHTNPQSSAKYKDRQCTYKLSMGAFAFRLLPWKGNKCYIFCVCVSLALATQHAMRMLHTVIFGLSASAIFSHIISQTTWFSEKVIDHEMRVLIFSTTIVWNISHSKKNSARYDKNVYWSSYKVPVTLVWF
jgi:hypothetical protein